MDRSQVMATISLHPDFQRPVRDLAIPSVYDLLRRLGRSLARSRFAIGEGGFTRSPSAVNRFLRGADFSLRALCEEHREGGALYPGAV